MDDSKSGKNGLLKCPCCGNYTINPETPMYAICPVCYWENDPLQLDEPDYAGGANSVSLNQARENYQMFGACEKDCISYVRKPNKDEM